MNIIDCFAVFMACEKNNMPEESKKMKKIIEHLIEQSYRAMKNEKKATKDPVEESKTNTDIG